MKRTFPLNVKSTAFVLLAGLCSFMQVAAQEDPYKYDGNTVTFHSQKFEIGPSPRKDTIVITDPMTGDEITKVVEKMEPVSMSGRKIYEINDVAAAPWNNGIALPLEEYLLKNFQANAALRSLADGHFRLYLNNIVINEQGKVIYYDLFGLTYTDKDGVPRPLGTQDIDTWMQNAPVLKPAMLNGKAIMARLNTSLSDNYALAVKDHEIIATKK